MWRIIFFLILLGFALIYPSMAANKGLEFRLVCESDDGSCEKVVNDKTKEEFLVHKDILLDSGDVEGVEKVVTQLSEDAIKYFEEANRVSNGKIKAQIVQISMQIKFAEEGKAKLEKLTRENLKKRLAMLINGNLIMAPNILEPIAGGVVWVTGQYTESEVDEMVKEVSKASEQK